MALGLPLGKYALFGSAPMGTRNLRDCHDADIIMSEDIWNTYRDKAGWTARVRTSRRRLPETERYRIVEKLVAGNVGYPKAY